MTDDDPFDDFDPDDHEWHPIPINVSDAWMDIMTTQGYLRDDPEDWGVVDVSRFDTHYLQIYVDEDVDEVTEGSLVPEGLLAFMAGRGWHVTYLGINQASTTDEWVPCIGFARGPEVFDSLVNRELSVTPGDYDWPPLQTGQPSDTARDES